MAFTASSSSSSLIGILEISLVGVSSLVFVVVTMFLWVRATFPRFRYDQIMRLGWKIFIPVTLVWLVVVGLWIQSPFNIWK